MEYLFFWGENAKNGFLSNFYPCKFTVNNNVYNCSEQYFMKQKQELFDPTNKELADNIMKETLAHNIKKYGRKVNNFDEKTWQTHKYKAMYDGVFAKFTQNPELEKKLLSTDSKILVEASPYDKIWGIGYTKSDAIKNINNWGENLLGKVLMEMRTTLKKQQKN